MSQVRNSDVISLMPFSSRKKISKKFLVFDSKIHQSEILGPLFDLLGPQIGENIKISKEETNNPSREHDFIYVHQKL